MASGYKILQKKLEELESQLDNVMSFPSDTPCYHLLAYDIRQRFSICNNLLSREQTITHHPKPDKHLLHITHKLAALESAFCAWDEFRTAAPVGTVETGSKCSCTESCLNDDDQEYNWTMGFEVPGGFSAAREQGKTSSSVLNRGGRCIVLALTLLNLVILTFPTVDYGQEFVLVPT